MNKFLLESVFKRDIVRRGLSKSFVFFFLFCGIINVGLSQDSTISHYPHFESQSLQNMWGPGDGYDINTSIELFPRFADKFSFDTRSGSIYEVAGMKFGAGVYASFEYGIGPMTFNIRGFELGSVEVKYPTKVDLEFPRDSSFNAGDTITLKTSYTVEPGYELNTMYPEAGEITLELPILFDIRAGVEFCLFACFDYSIFPPAFLNAVPGLVPNPMIDANWTIFGVNQDEITYPCTEITPSFPPQFPPQCTIPIPNPATADEFKAAMGIDSPLGGYFKIPYVETTTTLVGKNLVAQGADPYIAVTLDIINLLTYAPPPVGTFFKFVEYELELPDGGIPDAEGNMRAITIGYSLFSMDLEFPISQSQRFQFTPEVFVELSFPVELEYTIKDPVRRSSTPGKASNVRLPVGNHLTFRYPCDYAFMDFSAKYTIENDFHNKTYDRADLNLVFAAMEFGIEFPDFVIIPHLCIDIPLIGEVCIGLTLPGYSFGFGPLIGPETVPLAGFDFPPYVDRHWELEGFNEVVIPEPFRITPRKLKMDLIASNTVCHGDSSGGAALTVSGATPPLTYKWSTDATTPNLTNAPAGKHYVLIVDKNGCRGHADVVIDQPAPIWKALSGTNILCNGTATGAIDLSISGGAGSYDFLWSDGGIGEDRSGLAAGTYSVNIEDGNGCIVKDSITLTQPKALKTAISRIREPSCAGATDGSVEIAVSGGAEPYSYNWSHGATSKDIKALSANSYSVTVEDTNGCSAIQNVVVNEPSVLSTTLSVVKNVSCHSGKDGELLASAAGGTPPYQYKWLNNSVTLSETRESIKFLNASVYTVEIKDRNGCQSNKTISVSEPAEQLKSVLAPLPASCYSGTDGSIDVTVSGGTPPYSAVWSHGSTDLDVSGLSAGQYTVTILDGNGCSIQDKTVVIQPSKMHITPLIKEVSCSEQQDGSVSLQVTGGTGPYTIIWSGGETSTGLSGLAGGFYNATVSDQNSCSEFVTVEVATNEGKCLFIPNAYSPNGDGVNDTWVIRNIQLYPNSKLTVVNKWGDIVFKASPYSRPWDGTRNGQFLPPATYYYRLDLGNGEPEYTGPVTIIN